MKRSALAFSLAAALAACGTAGSGTGGAPGPANTPSTVDISMTATSGATTNGAANRSLQRIADEGAVVLRVPRTPDQVWAVLREAYADAGLPVATADSATRTVSSPRYEVSRQLGGRRLSAFFSCGDTGMGVPVADSYRITLTARSTVRTFENGSRVDTWVSATAVHPGTGAAVDCPTTGALESRVHDAVLRRLGVR